MSGLARSELSLSCGPASVPRSQRRLYPAAPEGAPDGGRRPGPASVGGRARPRGGLPDVRALRVVDAEARQEAQSRLALHVLGDGLHADGARDLGDRVNHALIDAVLREIAHERAVDLQVIDGQTFQ